MVTAWLTFLLLNFLTIDLISAFTYQRSMRTVGSVDNKTVCVLVDEYTAHRLQYGRNDRPLSLVRYEGEDACKPMPRPSGTKSADYVLGVYSSNCKLKKMIENARGTDTQSLMVVANLTKYPFGLDIGENPKNMSLIVIALGFYSRILNADTKKSDIQLQLLSSPPLIVAGYSAFALPILAVCTVIAGMFFSAHSRFKIKPVDSLNLMTSDTKAPKNENNARRGYIFVNVFLDAFFIVLLVTFILLLYFFYDIFVWVMIAILSICITIAFCTLITEVIVRFSSPSLNDRWRLKSCDQSELGANDIRGLFFLPICAVPPILLIVFRNERYIWILQNVCGMAVSIVFLRFFRFSKLKYVVTYAALLFIYDIFMVYCTPLFMSPGPRPDSLKNPLFHSVNQLREKRSGDGRTSVMEAIATGSAGKSGVRLPLVLLFPKVQGRGMAAERDACRGILSFWLLGLGDIIVPGVVAAFAYRCDLCLQEPTRRLHRLYSVVVVIGYMVGFVLISIILYEMETGQPALLTLLPCTVLPIVIVACIRKEIAVLWHGSGPLRPKLNEDHEETKKKEPNENTGLRQ